jgi:hypothetical protein
MGYPSNAYAIGSSLPTIFFADGRARRDRVVGATAVPAELVEFAEQERVVPAGIKRVEDRHAVHRQSDRAAEEILAG